MNRGFDAVVAGAGRAGRRPPPGPLLILGRARRWSRRSAARAVRCGARRSGAPGARSATRRRSTAAALADALDAALAGVVELGAAAPGDKTMVDALTPAVAALRAALEAPAAVDAPWPLPRARPRQGAQATVPMQARKGRASYLGERSIGHQDPGRDVGGADPARARARRRRRQADARARRSAGRPASPGAAAGAGVGCSTSRSTRRAGRADGARAAELARARAALEAAGGRARCARRALRRRGPREEAEIVETGALMAARPRAARAAVCALIAERRARAAAAILAARRDAQAAIARRARRRDARRARRRRPQRSAAAPRVSRARARWPRPGRTAPSARRRGSLVADRPRARRRRRARRAAWPASRSPAAARPRTPRSSPGRSGMPMVVGARRGLLTRRRRSSLVVDGDAGERRARAVARARSRPPRAARARATSCARGRARRARPPRGRRPTAARVRVLANVGRAGRGAASRSRPAPRASGCSAPSCLPRRAPRWPTEAEHRARARRRCSPRSPAGRRPSACSTSAATRRPPFLRGDDRRAASRCCSTRPTRSRAQLRADRRRAAAPASTCAILLPHGRAPPSELAAAAALVLPRRPRLAAAGRDDRDAGSAAGARRARWPRARTSSRSAPTTSPRATLGADRFARRAPRPPTTRACCATSRAVRAAPAAGIPSRSAARPRRTRCSCRCCVGLGVDELSVGAARVGTVRGVGPRRCRHADAPSVAGRALQALPGRRRSRGSSRRSRRGSSSWSVGDAAAQGVDGAGGVVAVGAQP